MQRLLGHSRPNVGARPSSRVLPKTPMGLGASAQAFYFTVVCRRTWLCKWGWVLHTDPLSVEQCLWHELHSLCKSKRVGQLSLKVYAKCESLCKIVLVFNSVLCLKPEGPRGSKPCNCLRSLAHSAVAPLGHVAPTLESLARCAVASPWHIAPLQVLGALPHREPLRGPAAYNY